MRMARMGMLLVVLTLLVARGRAQVVARHQPMHPDNTQVVTFQATAPLADRVTLSYTRYLLATLNFKHTSILVEDERTAQTCTRQGASGSLTCTYKMPFAFPPSSLIVYTARASGRAGNWTEAYAFAAGDWPWPDDPIPIRLKGDTTSKLDTVFIPDTDITLANFRDQLDEVLEQYFRYDAIRMNRGLHNFWYSGQQGHYEAFCGFTNPPNMANLTAVADVVAFLHTTKLRDCSSRPRMSAEIDDEKSIVHESGHMFYNLQDEYCCNSKYKPQSCAPNIYGTLASCEEDAPRLGFPISFCTQLTGTSTLNVWRVDPSTEPPCIMGPNQNKSTSVFREACARRMNFRYDNCLNGNCFPSPECP